MGSARRCLTCKVLFESIDALNDHCALTTHPLNAHQCSPCNRAFATSSSLKMHFGSRLHAERSRTEISAQDIDDHDTQPAAATVIYKVESLNPNVCSSCELRFDNHELLLEHYRTSSMHRFCLVCFQVFPSKELLDLHMKVLRHLKNQVVRIPKSKNKGNRKRKTTAPADVNPPPVDSPAVLSTEPTPQPELIDDDDLVLVERSSLILPTPQIQTPVTSVRQMEDAGARLPTSLLKCPGCQKNFHLFATFVLHIEIGACRSASKSLQINGEINALAAQLFRNISTI